MTNHQKARKIVRDYEHDKMTGFIAFGFRDPEKPIELVYYSERKKTANQIAEKLDSGAFCIGWIGFKKNGALYMRVPKEMKAHHADCAVHLLRVLKELQARDPNRLQ